jgi:glycosyltransferase involved in cell wall biosynthesis
MKKVGMLNDIPYSFAYGGKEVQMTTYRKYLNSQFDKEIEVSLLDFWDKNYLKQIEILHLFGYSNWFYDLIKTLKSNQNKKIIISPTFYYQNIFKVKLASSLSKLCPIPNFFSYKKEIFNRCDKIIVNSNAEKKQLTNFFGKQLNSKIKIIYNAIEHDFIKFSDENNKSSFLEEYSLEPGYLLSVSFLDERKNILNLLKAYLEIKDEINKKLIIIGDFRFRNEQNLLLTKDIIEKNKDFIIHLPYINRNNDLLKSAYHNCAAHLLPSLLETPGISNLEALYFGKPILVGDCEPVREYFEGTAEFCDPKSVKSIREGITRVTNNVGYSESRVNHIVENYLLESVVTEIYRIYEDSY